MKGRKLLALALALVLALGLAVPAFAAEKTTHADYNDLMAKNPNSDTYQWEWAWPTVDDAIDRGWFIGYTPYKDAEGKTITNFGPGDAVTQAVGLTLCGRLMVDKDLREQILEDRLEQMRDIIPGTDKDPDDANAPFMWFRREAAACLELGIIDEGSLVDLRDDDLLGEAMTKAEFAKYLVRAMGLEDFAKTLASDSLPFADASSIDREYRPYVKLLTTYGVLTGDENNNFNPHESMSRAVCATMLSRAYENIVIGRKVDLEIPNYTDYQWTAGIIKSVDVTGYAGRRTLTLEGLFGGESTYDLPLGAAIYLYNKQGEATDLKVGSYAKLIYASDQSTIASIRLIPAGLMSKITGVCNEVGEKAVKVDGVDYTLNRFTQVSAGGRTGGVEVIDPKANYTYAELTADSRGTVITLTLSGGTRQLDGILTDITVNSSAATPTTSITVNSFNGMPTTYTLAPNTPITVNGQTTQLLAGYKGKHVVLRVDDEKLGDVQSVDVDAGSSYIQGVLDSVTTTGTDKARQVQITKTGESKRTPYEVHQTCDITYEGAAVSYGALISGSYVTAKVEGGVITAISAWSGTDQVTGVLTGRTYGDPTLLTVTKEDGTVVQFSVPLSELTGLVITVGGKESDMTRVNTGDTVTVTLRYHRVTQLDVTPQEANVTGILESITHNEDGTTLLNLRFTDGTKKQYTATAATTVTREGLAVAISDVQAGAQVALVAEGDTALSIQLTGTAARQDSVEGIIYTKDESERILTLLVNLNGQTKPVNVHIPSGVTIYDVNTGTTTTSFLRLSTEETIQVFGSYNTDGTFEAKSVIRK